MCKWGDTVDLVVPISAKTSNTGEFRWAVKGIDRCIADLVDALNKAYIYTEQSCCGHGKTAGQIALQDGRMITITGFRVKDGQVEEYILCSNPERLATPIDEWLV